MGRNFSKPSHFITFHNICPPAGGNKVKNNNYLNGLGCVAEAGVAERKKPVSIRERPQKGGLVTTERQELCGSCLVPMT
jgi:hypothetical protein